jgi:hypothetical protein
MLSDTSLQMFLRKITPLSSGFNSGKTKTQAGLILLPTSCWFIAWIILGLEDGITAIFRNVCELVAVCMQVHHRKEYPLFLVTN